MRAHYSEASFLDAALFLGQRAVADHIHFKLERSGHYGFAEITGRLLFQSRRRQASNRKRD